MDGRRAEDLTASLAGTQPAVGCWPALLALAVSAPSILKFKRSIFVCGEGGQTEEPDCQLGRHPAGGGLLSCVFSLYLHACLRVCGQFKAVVTAFLSRALLQTKLVPNRRHMPFHVSGAPWWASATLWTRRRRWSPPFPSFVLLFLCFNIII